MAVQPTIVLVHGFWGGAAHWAKVIVQLNKLGYAEIRAVENPLTSLADDAARTRKMVTQQKGPVLLVGHSYGGMGITEVGTAPNVAGVGVISPGCPESRGGGGSHGVGVPRPRGGDAFVRSAAQRAACTQ